jgi:undecaprenyl-diphosphatase
MFDLIKSAVLGIVEGITEFLPVSSTGHLIIVNRWISFSQPFTQMFDVVIQLGAILAVVVYFWHRIWPFGKGADQKAVFSLWKKAIIGCLPAIVLGALFGSFVETKLFNPLVVAAALIVGGIIIIVVETKKRATKINTINDLKYPSILMIGLAQCLAMIPGTSRSAATIVGALLLGASRTVAAEYSFFLAIPTMIAATGYSFLKHRASLGGHDLVVLALGFVVAFLTALWAVKTFMNYIRTKSFTPFGWYRIALGIIVLGILFL